VAALRRVATFEQQGLSNSAWTSTTLDGTDGPALDATSSALLQASAAKQMDGRFILGAAWPLWRTSRPDAEAEQLVDCCLTARSRPGHEAPPDAAAMGFCAMLAEWRRDTERGAWLHLEMARSDGLRLPEVATAGNLFGSTRLLRRVPSGSLAYLEKKYHKLVSLIDFILASGAVGAEAVVHACEVFASGSQRQWLKVAGEAKAEVVDWTLGLRPTPERSTVVEFGSFVGYSCIRMAWCSGGRSPILSLECDAVHVLVARFVVNEARCSQAVEVCSGPAGDSARRQVEDWGARSAAMVFMDHRGTRFHAELRHLERLDACMPAGKLLADNTLKPGAPVLLWHLATRHRRVGAAAAAGRGDRDDDTAAASPTLAGASSWSLPEFLMEHRCEDWMTIADFG